MDATTADQNEMDRRVGRIVRLAGEAADERTVDRLAKSGQVFIFPKMTYEQIVAREA